MTLFRADFEHLGLILLSEFDGTFWKFRNIHATPYSEPIEKITISLEYMFYASGDL